MDKLQFIQIHNLSVVQNVIFKCGFIHNKIDDNNNNNDGKALSNTILLYIVPCFCNNINRQINSLYKSIHIIFLHFYLYISYVVFSIYMSVVRSIEGIFLLVHW